MCIRDSPSWRDDYDAGNRKVLNIDPGLAFGTGGHETTRLCLEICEKYLKEGDSVLDVGCGSGILGIATLLLGADRAVGVDIDETAVRTAAENAEINGVADRFTAICGSFTDKVEGKYDIVLANIVADAIMFLSKGIKDFMKDDAVYIMSGIIDTRAEEVKASVSQYFDIIEEHLDNGWACFAARRAAVRQDPARAFHARLRTRHVVARGRDRRHHLEQGRGHVRKYDPCL